jgi:hypothetical protein
MQSSGAGERALKRGPKVWAGQVLGRPTKDVAHCHISAMPQQSQRLCHMVSAQAISNFNQPVMQH